MQGFDPMIIFYIAILIMSAVIHEVSHGMAAFMQGDPTAKDADRLTLNPIKHLDLFGSVILPLIFIITSAPFFFAYAKPVPYNPYNLKNQRWGPAIVGVAGPAANILIGILFAIIFRLSESYSTFSNLVFAIVQINIWLALFNLVPIPPLDGSKLLFSLLPPKFYNLEAFMEQYGFFILIILIFILPGILFVPLGALASIILRLLVGA
ncbi:hypothetical protein A3H65_00400 [Candidatus Giovannonibacteria bacterium RIFCSPLOWO2_02_FULL_45_14]|uniref:Peptidase M50 n=3 Tax=Parcubacteria group TaxID=1794811 RepID=A0A0H4TXH3_9BACT|nr:peptidase M50 [uncultured Parcubacteria bacterium Rifle_16ft_4_minimus_37658]AKQ05734.1 peptidase M50 [uncultured Parcubacteria bacterium Rifle_16ft_4_minimus_23641]OGF69261.1 MAG: hypothetical protein A3C75_03670 [Candidatus Giovannonibacteria bacterium RIFCSPHIGHO2_02_FULL_44_31]OGF76278.1 MAG: hypothetical protein A3E62_04075 [Candidatus Giovannonibacteria bacterium RIFCSPHIGHO2_12_FULL_44_29]OGF91171.1 MAG: hypothetical protein A3H65_00400 [Candidatus Giovannonibacteria bacterium RIFCSPL